MEKEKMYSSKSLQKKILKEKRLKKLATKLKLNIIKRKNSKKK